MATRLDRLGGKLGPGDSLVGASPETSRGESRGGSSYSTCGTIASCQSRSTEVRTVRPASLRRLPVAAECAEC